MKKLIFVLTLLTMLASFSLAVEWQFEEQLFRHPNRQTVVNGNGFTGVAVDGDGNVWVAGWNTPTDSIVTDTDTTYLQGIFVFDSNGNQLDFSPINIIEYDGTADTLGSCWGLRTAHDGHVLFAGSGYLYKFNYQTGEPVDYYDWPEKTSSTTCPDVAEDGTIFWGSVGPDYPVIMLDQDLEKIGDAIDSASGCYNRAVTVSPDGEDIYLGSTWSGLGVRHFHSDIPGTLPHEPGDTLGNYEMTVDDTTIMSTLWPEHVHMGPDGYIYCANTQSEWSDSLRGSKWIIIDPETDEQVGSIGMRNPVDLFTPVDDPSQGGYVWNGRGIDWSADGQTMYVVDFGYNNLTKWTKVENATENEVQVSSSFDLKENYPNPFNPTTTIPFTLEKQANVTLKVYNMLGQEVVTLVDNEMKNAGYNRARFDASNLSAGVYLYRISSEGQHMTKKMMLIK